jgi:hypothetical protein
LLFTASPGLLFQIYDVFSVNAPYFEVEQERPIIAISGNIWKKQFARPPFSLHNRPQDEMHAFSFFREYFGCLQH